MTREQALEAALRTAVEIAPGGMLETHWGREARAALALPPEPAPAAAGAHTPGPWQYLDGMVFEAREPDGWKICNLADFRPHQSIEAMAANGCLIAVAPDMLAALQAILDEMAGGNPTLSPLQLADFIRNTARAAIARATKEG